ncbi:MAG: ABC transporter substrate-binding protein [Aigarchaeota archaeon]|nr:ABC transporter substrate-binding protein [Aigarchaeota archaeon]MCX8193191.1 ABC transporter substrate-binding protein [Nitrososphaeria archaeon]MDW7986332.1 ABC transporter substrate-binding protein [Nitrososphaerota archaeon]
MNSRCNGLTKLQAIVVVIVLVIGVAVGGIFAITLLQPTTPTAKVEEIRVGLVEPLTGTYAVFGNEAKMAAELIVEQINAQGGIKSLGGAKIKLIVEDSKSTADGARLAAEKLVSVDRVNVIVGAFISAHTLTMLDVTEPNKVIVMADALVDYLTARGFKYIVRLPPKASVHGATAVDFVVGLMKQKGEKITRPVLVHFDGLFGEVTGDGVYQRLRDLGIKLVDRIKYPTDITDMAPIIERIKAAEPDVVFVVPYFADSVLFAKAVKTLGLKVKFIAAAGGTGLADPDSIKAAGDAVELMTNTYSYDPFLPTEYNKKLVEDFRKRYGKLPTEAAGIIFYTLWTLKEGLELSGQKYPQDPLNGDNLMACFMELDLKSGPAAETYPTGRIKLLPNGDNMYAGAVVLQVQGGKPVLVYPFEKAQASAIYPRP